MKFKFKKLGENGIALAYLLIIIIISVILIGLAIKGIFDFKTMGATGKNKLNLEEVVGKYIDYKPSQGSYNQITSDKKYVGSISGNDFTTDTSLNWRIWSIDDEKITLISDKPVSVRWI